MERIGVGDEVFFPGLFVPVNTGDKNIPIVRHGNLAMLPSQPIVTEYGVTDRFFWLRLARLAELAVARSGVRETISTDAIRRETGLPVAVMGIGTMKLLGMIQAHWDYERYQ